MELLGNTALFLNQSVFVLAVHVIEDRAGDIESNSIYNEAFLIASIGDKSPTLLMSDTVVHHEESSAWCSST